MTHAESITPIRHSLARKLWQPTPRAQKPEKKTPRRPTKEPDWAILEARRLRETHGMSCAAIAARMTELGVPMVAERACCICNYTTRANLIPQHNRREPYTP